MSTRAPVFGWRRDPRVRTSMVCRPGVNRWWNTIRRLDEVDARRSTAATGTPSMMTRMRPRSRALSDTSATSEPVNRRRTHLPRVVLVRSVPPYAMAVRRVRQPPE